MRNQLWGRNGFGLLFATILSLMVAFHGETRRAMAQCSLIDTGRDALFITYERPMLMETDNGKAKDGVLLRLHNNSTCAVIITTASAEKFFKPLPENATAAQRIKRDIEYNLPDNVLVPDIQYLYLTSCGAKNSVGGDMFFGFKLLAKRSILFEVALRHFDRSPGNKIALPFRYVWEQQNRARDSYPGVENTVQFWSSELPDDIKAKIR